jgi:hypothetical protein
LALQAGDRFLREVLRQGCAEPGDRLRDAAEALVLSGLKREVAGGVEAKDPDVMNHYAPERHLVMDRANVGGVSAEQVGDVVWAACSMM